MAYRYLTLEDRKAIEEQYSSGNRPLDIAISLGVHTATIYHELQRGSTGELDEHARPVYSADLAQKHVQESIKRRGRRTKNNRTE